MLPFAATITSFNLPINLVLLSFVFMFFELDPTHPPVRISAFFLWAGTEDPCNIGIAANISRFALSGWRG